MYILLSQKYPGIGVERRSHQFNSIEKVIYDIYKTRSEIISKNIRNVSINFDEEIFDLLTNKFEYYDIYLNTDKDFIELNLKNSQHVEILNEKILSIFNNGLQVVKRDEYKECDKSNCDKNLYQMIFINIGFVKCRQLLSTNTAINLPIEKYIDLLLKDKNLIAVLIILDTFHDLKRVSFLTDVYKKMLKRNFFDDYLYYINNIYGKDIHDILKEILKRDNFEIHLFTSLVKKIKPAEFDHTTFFKNKLAIDVWGNRNVLKTNYDVNTIYTSYFDSNPTNSQFEEDVKYEKLCSSISFNILSSKILYKYNLNDKLEVSFKGVSDGIGNMNILTKTDVKSDQKVNDEILNWAAKLNNNFGITIEKLLKKGSYNTTNNTYNYSGKKSGPSIAEICAVILLMIYVEIQKGKSDLKTFFDLFESGFFIKRAGDLGQVLLAKKIGYIFATNDYIQACFSILNGNKTIVTCGNIKIYQSESSLDSVVNSMCYQ